VSAVVGYTTGVYDMFHIGHLNVLRAARQMCDRLVVGVTTDDLSEARKGKRPIIPQDERMDIVRSIRYVDEVVPQATMDKMAAWRDVGFNTMFVGDDWKGTVIWNRFEREFALVGVKIAYLPYTGHTSSTALRALLFGA
jgi:glycerol-3-phosphate cytidylyltransferase